MPTKRSFNTQSRMVTGLALKTGGKIRQKTSYSKKKSCWVLVQGLQKTSYWKTRMSCLMQNFHKSHYLMQVPKLDELTSSSCFR